MPDSYRKALLIVLALVTSIAIFNTSERCFGNADRRNAITMVQSLRARPGAPTIPDALVQRHPGSTLDTIRWSATITDVTYGFVRVRAAVPAPGAVEEYLFDVNLAGQRLHPANEASRALMLSLRDLPMASEGNRSE